VADQQNSGGGSDYASMDGKGLAGKVCASGTCGGSSGGCELTEHVVVLDAGTG